MKIEKTETKIRIQSDYHKDLPKAARQLGGKWDAAAREWVFDIRTEKEVEELYTDIYGCFGEPAETVTIRYRLTDDLWAAKSAVFICGRQVARAWGRDSGTKVGDGVVLKDCKARSGGSMKNWATCIDITGDNPEIIIYDVPKKKAESCEDVEIMETKIDREKLAAEKERLLARIAEIDELLK